MSNKKINHDNRNDSDDEENVNESTPILKTHSSRDITPSRPSVDGNDSNNRSRTKVAAAIRKISNMGDLSTSVNELAASGQIDDHSYSFEKTIVSFLNLI